MTSTTVWRTFKNTIQEIYEGIDVVVAATRNDEPFALVALEANMLSIPVIASNKGGFPESIVDGFNGFLVEASNPVCLANRISILSNNRSLVKQMGESGRKRMLENFTLDKMIQKIIKMIQEI